MLTDPKLEHARIVRQTSCRAGTHVFTYSGAFPRPFLRCDCITYTWREWQRVLENRDAD